MNSLRPLLLIPLLPVLVVLCVFDLVLINTDFPMADRVLKAVLSP